MKYHPVGGGRYLMRLDPGDEIIACLRQMAGEAEIASGFISGIGSTASATMSWLDPDAGEYVRRKFEEPMEVANLSGTISADADDGRPFIHLHAVLAPRELLAYAGHIHEARTGLVMEVLVTAFEEPIKRHAIPGKPFPWLLLPGEPPPGEEPAEDEAKGS